MEGSKDAESAKKVGPVGLLNIREESWSRRLRGSSLIAEVDVKDTYSEQVASVCDCGEETSCYGCLRSFRNQAHHEDLSRAAALGVLGPLTAAGLEAERTSGTTPR
ncbi:hypothetical protein [Streptosporangium sp. NBC_01469]|uniref:hypothetical protein n=1 Tax=Streptosporangium sp. NBC_01469 TaxID=2903898 RepID=UPI002E29C498|nr:hypothetical protein [Streptosporangium sp. NBC_01469]